MDCVTKQKTVSFSPFKFSGESKSFPHEYWMTLVKHELEDQKLFCLGRKKTPMSLKFLMFKNQEKMDK